MKPPFVIRFPTIRARTLLAILCLGAFVLTMGTLAYFPIPETNKELFAQMIGALTLMVGGIAAFYWPRDTKNDGEPPENRGDG